MRQAIKLDNIAAKGDAFAPKILQVPEIRFLFLSNEKFQLVRTHGRKH